MDHVQNLFWMPLFLQLIVPNLDNTGRVFAVVQQPQGQRLYAWQSVGQLLEFGLQRLFGEAGHFRCQRIGN